MSKDNARKAEQKVVVHYAYATSSRRCVGNTSYSEKGTRNFAKKTLPPGIIIGDYLGRVINNSTDDTTEKNGLYLMYYHDRASLYPVDIQAPGIHLINHSCMPNVWFYTYKGHTLFFTLRTIFPEEELTADYLLSPAEYCNHCLHQCTCETILCRKTMHLSQANFQTWNAFHQAQGKKTKRLPIRYGQLLKPLTTYPQSIPDHAIYNLFGTTSLKPSKSNETTLPATQQLRDIIRKTGRMQAFVKLDILVLGIQNGSIKTLLAR